MKRTHSWKYYLMVLFGIILPCLWFGSGGIGEAIDAAMAGEATLAGSNTYPIVGKTFSFSSPTIVNCHSDFICLEMTNLRKNIILNTTAGENEPEMPKEHLYFLLPEGIGLQNLKINVYPGALARQDLPKPVKPGGRIVPMDQMGNESLNPGGIYESIGPFPVAWHGQPTVKQLGPFKILDLPVYPVQLYPLSGAEGEIEYTESLMVAIDSDTAPSPSTVTNASKEVMETAKSLIENPESIPAALPPADSYDYLIIAPDAFMSPFESLATEYTNNFGIKTEVHAISTITNPAIPSKEDIRNHILKEYTDHWIQYVLLAGDLKYASGAKLIPTHEMTHFCMDKTKNNWCEIYCTNCSSNAPCTGCLGEMTVLTDWYYAGLTENCSDLRGSTYPAAPCWSSEYHIDTLAEVYVGRAPVSNTDEAINFVNKTLLYKNEGYLYRNNMLAIGKMITPAIPPTAQLTQFQNILGPVPGKGYSVTVLGETAADCYQTFTDDVNCQTDNTVLPAINSTGAYLGTHFNLISWVDHSSAPRDVIVLRYNATNIGGQTDLYFIKNINNPKPAIIYSLGCHGGSFDGQWWSSNGTLNQTVRDPAVNEDSVGEMIVALGNSTIFQDNGASVTSFPGQGAAAYIGNSRTSLYSSSDISQGPSPETQTAFLALSDQKSIGSALYQAKDTVAKNITADHSDWLYAINQINLLGDPTLMIAGENPWFDRIDYRQAVEGSEVVIPVQAHDRAGATFDLLEAQLSYENGTPIGSSADYFSGTGNGTGTFSWVPPSGSAGSRFKVVFTARAGGYSNTYTTWLFVVPATPQVLISVWHEKTPNKKERLVTITWSSANVTACELSVTDTKTSPFQGWIGPIETSGTISENIESSGEVTITCNGPDGQASGTVTVSKDAIFN